MLFMIGLSCGYWLLIDFGASIDVVELVSEFTVFWVADNDEDNVGR
jgi:hypothetical protein